MSVITTIPSYYGVNVLTLGVKGDGVTDDTSAIQAAVNTGQVLFFPNTANFYKTTSVINLTVSVYSNGAEIRLAQDGTSSKTILRIAANTAPIVIHGFVLNGLYSGGTASEFSMGVDMYKASAVTISANTIKNTYGDCVGVFSNGPQANQQCSNVSISNNILLNPRRCNVAITSCDGISVVQNTCSKTIDYVSAVDLEPDADGVSYINNVYIAGNSFVCPSDTITCSANNSISNTNLVITGNTATGNRFFVGYSNALLTGAMIANNTFINSSLNVTNMSTFASVMFYMDTVLLTSLIGNVDNTTNIGVLNLMFQSNSLTGSKWALSNATIATGISAPDTTLTAWKLTEAAIAGKHILGGHGVKDTASKTITLSVYAKLATGTARRVQLEFDADVGYVYAVYNISTHTVDTAAATDGVEFTAPSSSITTDSLATGSGGNGWYRCILSATTNESTAAFTVAVTLDNGTANNYTGDGASGILLWGFEANYTPTAQTYVATNVPLVYTSSLFQTNSTLTLSGNTFL